MIQPTLLPDDTRIVLARMPQLLRDLLRDSLEQHPHVVVEDDVGHEDVGSIMARTHADGLILAAPGGSESAFSNEEIARALFRSPRTRILMVSDGGTTARLHELLPTITLVSDVTPSGLGDAILSRLDAARVGS